MSIDKIVCAIAEKKQPRVSVIIPTYNGGLLLENVLVSLQKQSLVPCEICVIDSSSGDETCEVARSFGASVQIIAKEEFDHGGTRTVAGQNATGDILVYMTQDAILVGNDALEKLVEPLRDSRIAASYGRQLPGKNATPFARHLRLFNYPDKSVVRCWTDREKYGFKTAFISNSFAAYKKECLESIGFFESGMIFGEDSFTVAKLLNKDYCVAYVAEAKVEHSHNYSMFQEFRRYFDIGVFHVNQREVLERFGSPVGEGGRYVRSEITHLIENNEKIRIVESFMRNGLKFLAFNLGKKHAVLPRQLAVFFSLNRGWWR